MRLLSAALVLALTGCASSGVIPADGDSYFISKKNAAGAFGSVESVKGDLYAEANAYCKGKGRQVQTVTVSTEAAIIGSRMGGASLQFRCVAPG